MGRSIKKGPYVDANLEGKVEGMNDGKTKKGVIKTWSRRSTITPDFVGHTFAVHNGNKFIRYFYKFMFVGTRFAPFKHIDDSINQIETQMTIWNPTFNNGIFKTMHKIYC